MKDLIDFTTQSSQWAKKTLLLMKSNFKIEYESIDFCLQLETHNLTHRTTMTNEILWFICAPISLDSRDLTESKTHSFLCQIISYLRLISFYFSIQIQIRNNLFLCSMKTKSNISLYYVCNKRFYLLYSLQNYWLHSLKQDVVVSQSQTHVYIPNI